MKGPFHISAESPWSVRDFRIAASARTLSFVGDGVALTTLTLVMHDLGHGPSSVALLLIAAALPTVLLAPVAGRVADEVDSRKILTIATLISAAAAFSMAMASSAWTLLGLVVALQAAQAFADPSWAALTPRIVGEERTGRAIGSMQMLLTMALVAGPALAGLIVGVADARIAFLVDGSTFLVLAGAALAIRTRRSPVRTSDESDTESPSQRLVGLHVLRSDAILGPLVFMLVVFVLGGESANVIEVFLIRDSLQGSSVAYGLAGALGGAGMFVGVWIAARWRQESTRVRGVVGSALTMAVLMIAAGLSPSLAIALIAFAVSGVANGALNVSFATLMILRTPDRRRGRVVAVVSGLTRACAIIGPALGGAVGGLAGPRTMFVSIGLVVLTFTGLAAIPVLRARVTDRMCAEDRSERPADVLVDEA